MLTERDTRIDVFRALALLTIYIDHIPGTLFDRFTIHNFGFADAAEAFVLISGLAVGLAYAPKFKPGGRLATSLKVWRRAGVLYAVHIVTTAVTLTIFCGAAVFAERPDLLHQINIWPLIADTPRALIGIGILGHQLGYNNILSLYAVVMLLTPPLLWLLNYNIRLGLTLSGLVWLAAGIWQIAPPNYPTAGVWFLNPLSWQFLFAIGIAATMHVRRGGKLPNSPWLTGAALVYAVVAFVWIHSPLWGKVTWLDLPPVLGGFDKTYLSLSRLVHILSLAYLVVTLPAIGNLARLRPDHPLSILGKHSLPVFVAGTMAAMVAQVARAIYGGALPFDIMLISTGMCLQFGLAYYLEWLAHMGLSAKGAATRVPRNAGKVAYHPSA